MTQPSNDTQRMIDRREALRRAALLLGGALSASTVAGVLAGCEVRRPPNGAWAPRALSSDELELVATIAEHILPETETPGARTVGAHRFIDAMLADSYPDEERRRFLTGLADVDARAQRSCGRAFLRCATAEQRTLLEQLDREAFGGPVSVPERGGVMRSPSPEGRGGQGVRTRGGTPTKPEVPFFRSMKELTLVGYYTSEAGATRELRHAPVPGRFEGCVPLDQIGRAWSV